MQKGKENDAGEKSGKKRWYNPSLIHVLSICAGTVGILFTLASLVLLAITFDSTSVASAAVAVYLWKA